MTRFLSTSIELFCCLALFAMLALIGCSSGSNGNANGSANTSPKTILEVDCMTGNPSSAQIQDAIYAGMLGKPYAAEIDHFNISARNPPVVKIVGWSAYKTEIINLAKSAAKGCTIDASALADNGQTPCSVDQERIGCPSGYGPCGDICIPEGELCKVTNRPVPSPGWYCVPKPTPRPSASPTSTASSGVNPVPTAKY